ncbi:MAG: hypothetical protein IJD64_00290 [Clostridia bacterium]|nr:hypothetical protein [Clostridia bacterium]
MNLTPQNPIGTLIVKVTTARGAIPLAGASVNIRGATVENSGVLYSLRTNRDGQTEKVALPTPPRSNSETPNGGTPYALYTVDVAKEGYLPQTFERVPVFPSILSIQPAVMIPAPESLGETIPEFPSTVIPEPPSADL